MPDSMAPLLELACRAGNVGRGAVLAVTPGEGPLAEVGLHGLDRDGLNVPPPLGGYPASRRFVTGGQALYGAGLMTADGKPATMCRAWLC